MNDYLPRRAILLARISDARNGDTHGVDGQVKLLRADARKKNWTAGPAKTHVIVENDVSAFKRYATCPSCLRRSRQCTCPPLPGGQKRRTELRTWRPGFRRALTMLKTGDADGLLCYDLDRAMRDSRDLEDLLDVVKERTEDGRTPDIAVDSFTGSLRALHTSSGQQTARLLVGVAIKSSEDTARRVAARRQAKAAAGEYAGGRRPYGWQRNGRTVVKSEAAEIRHMADAVLSGMSLRALAADLRRRKVPTVTQTWWAGLTPAGKDRVRQAEEKAAAEQGRQPRDYATVAWTPDILRDLLLKPRLAGLAVYQAGQQAKAYRKRGEPVPPDCGVAGTAKWPAILDRDTWLAVAWKLTDPARRTTPGNEPRWLGSMIYRCGICARAGITETVSVQGKRRGGGTARSYCCRGPVAHLRRSAGAVDWYVTELLIRRLARPDAAELFRRRDTGPDRAKAGKELDALRTRKQNLLDLVDSGAYTLDEVKDKARVLNRKIQALEAQLAPVPEQSPLDGLPLGTAGVAEAWAALPLHTRRAVLRELVTVTLLPGRMGRIPRDADGNPLLDPDTIRIEWKQ